MEKTFRVFKGFIMSLAIFALSSALFVCLLKFTAVPEKGGTVYLLLCFSLATLFFGMYLGSLTGKRGLFYGGVGGILFVVPVFYSIAVLLGQPFAFGISDLRFLVPVIFGSLGGMIGVNIKN